MMDEQKQSEQAKSNLRLINLSPGIWTFKVDDLVRAAVTTPNEAARSSSYKGSEPRASDISG